MCLRIMCVWHGNPLPTLTMVSNTALNLRLTETVDTIISFELTELSVSVLFL